MKYHSLGCSINSAIWAPNNNLIASGADDGQIHMCTPKGELLHTQQAYINRNVPVNSLSFTNQCEFLAAGLQDGVIKIWEAKKKDYARVFRSSTNSISSITSAQFNLSNTVLAASNLKGYINIFPMNDLMTRETSPQNFSQTPISELFSFKPTDSKINSIRFSPFKEEIICSAQDDATVSLYDINTQEMTGQFNNHRGSVRGVCFSTLSKLLLCSAGLDKFAYFYDIKQKMSVNKINLNVPVQSVSFAYDGKTVAFGANSSGSILVYDLRNSKEPLIQLEGHKHTVHSIQFKWKESSTKVSKQEATNKVQEQKKNLPQKQNQPEDSQQFQTKTIQQLKEEARRNVDMKLQKLNNQRNNISSVATDAQSVTTNISDRAPIQNPSNEKKGKGYSELNQQKLISLEETKESNSQERLQNQYYLNNKSSPKAILTNQTPTLPTQFQFGKDPQKELIQNLERRQMEINVEDTEMKMEDIEPDQLDFIKKKSNQQFDLVKDLEVNQDQRVLIEEVVDSKFKQFSDNYEIDGLVKEYMVDPDDQLSDAEEIEVERDLVQSDEDELAGYLE